MSTEVSRREFLYGAEALVLASLLNRAYAHVAPEDLAGDEEFWGKIRSAYLRDPKLINLNNGGVAPAPTSVLDAEIQLQARECVIPPDDVPTLEQMGAAAESWAAEAFPVSRMLAKTLDVYAETGRSLAVSVETPVAKAAPRLTFQYIAY